MSERNVCQYLGHPSDGLFYYQKKATKEIIFVESNDEVDAFISGDLDQCPPHCIVDERRPIFVTPRGMAARTVVLDVFLPYSTEDEGEKQGCVPLGDLLWLLERGYVPPSRVKLGEGLEDFRLLFWALLLATGSQICNMDSQGNLEDY